VDALKTNDNDLGITLFLDSIDERLEEVMEEADCLRLIL